MTQLESRLEMLTFTDRHKYEVQELFAKLDKSPHLADELRSILQPIADNLGLPPEWCSMESCPLGLARERIGGNRCPMLRTQAHKNCMRLRNN